MSGRNGRGGFGARARAGYAACAALALAAAWPVSAAEPYPIPVVLTLTGGGAFLGQGERESLEIAQRAINASGGIGGRPVQFVFHDDQTNPQVAVQLASEILASKPAVIIGSSLVASCRAMAPLMQNGPVQYCLSPGIHPEPGSYIYSAAVSTHDQIDLDVRYFRLRGWKRIAFIVSTDATGQDAEDGFKATLARPENRDMRLVEVAHFNTGDVSVAAQIEAIKAARPQCLIAWATGTPVATIFRAMVDAGLDLPTATTGGNMTYRQMEQYASFLPKELYLGAAQWIVRDPAMLAPAMRPMNAEFYKFFGEAGRKPEVPSELAWDPAMIVVAGLRARGADATAAQLHEFIAHLKDFPGVDGIYDFERLPQRGIDGSDTVVTRWSPAAGTWLVMSKPGGVPLRR